MQNCRHVKAHWSEITTTTTTEKNNKTTEAADENMKHKAQKQKTAAETIEAQQKKNKGCECKKRRKDHSQLDT